MTLVLSLLSRSLDSVAAVRAILSDGLRRLRYRRADLRRLPTADMPPDPSSRGDACRWTTVPLRGRTHVALACRAGSRVAYDTTLPADASIVSWVAIAPDAERPSVDPIEFEIHVRAQGLESSGRRVLDPRRPAQRRWQMLRVQAPAAGPARIVLTTRSLGGDGNGAPALWGDPCIQAPRPAASFAPAFRSALATWGFRGLLHRTFAAGDDLYALWVREHRPSRRVLRAQREWSRTRTKIFSVITFVEEPAGWPDRRTAGSLIRQSDPGWEWILVATEDAIKAAGAAGNRWQRDPRVRILGVPAHSTRAQAWNAAMRAASTEFAAILGPRDALSPDALYEMAAAIERAPNADLLYSDEDRISRRGSRRHTPQFKPCWSPDLLLAHNYIGRLTMIRRDAAEGAGGFRDGYDDAEEWDLYFRLSRRTARIERVPRCLYHRDEADRPERPEAEGHAIRDHCAQLGRNGDVSKSADVYRVIWPVQAKPLVSIVIPNRDAAAVITQCVSGLLDGTSYPHRELVIVDNGSTDPAVLELYRAVQRTGRGAIVPFGRPFNFSAACNAGAARARGGLLLFLNNDIEIIDPDWLDELVRWAVLPDVGIVGAKLLYPDRTIQHAGVVFGLGLVGHIFSRAPEGTSSLFGSSDSYRNYLGVTGACQMMRKDVFSRLGGYDERFRLSFSDIVLCMEAWRAGLRVVYTPHARLLHHESFTRKREDWPEDVELLVRYLETSGFVEDPYFHPELDPQSPVPSIRPPFGPTPRQAVRDYADRVLAAAAMAGR